MPKKYDGPIDRNTDFTHAGPNGEPASGLAVQTYIKKIDADKVGVGYYEEEKFRHLLFADEADKNAYIADPTNPDKQALIKYIIQLKSPYTIDTNLLTPSFVPVFLGSTGNYLRYTFVTTSESGAVVQEGVVATYTITRHGTSRTVTETYHDGETVAFNLDQYLAEGENTISVTIRGQVSRASTFFSVTYQVINLTLTDTFDISTTHSVSASGGTMAVQCAVSGTGKKTMEWYVDGVRVPYNQEEDEINETSLQLTKYISIADLAQGRHSLQFRVGLQVSGETFYSDVHYREFVVSTGAAGDPIVVIATEFPASAGILLPSDTLTVYAAQYETLNLRVAAWNPDHTYKNTVTAFSGAIQLASTICTEEEESVLPLTFSAAGAVALTLTVGETPRVFTLSVAQTSMNIQEITLGLELAFSAGNRTNDSANKDYWSDGAHTATFSGFNWTETSGWTNGRLLIPSGASLSFNYAPLAADATANGKTLEFDIRTVNVNDDDEVLMNLIDSNGAGIKLTATEILVVSRQGARVSRRFKTDEDLRISIVINRASGSTNKGLLFVYFNGILSMATNFADTDKFFSTASLSFGGVGVQAGLLLKQVRIYNTALASAAILNNYILYRDTVAEMRSIYEHNDLYENGASLFDINKIAAYLPVMVITGNIPAIENTTDKNLQIVADVQYINLQDPSRSFSIKNAAIRGQGTTSMTYPKKNLRLYTRKLDTTILYDAEGNPVADRLYSFKEGAQPVDCWCLKTDFAESSGSHNTGVARLWNDVMVKTKIGDNFVLRTNAQKAAAAAGYQYDVRTTVDGFPIVVFYHLTEDDDLIFLGKYNFNNDKSTESVFGFTDLYVGETKIFDGSNVQCFEFLNSSNQLALFQTVEGFDEGWDEAWESRYPDTKTPNLTPLKTLATWIVSTKNNLQEWIDHKANHFDLPKLAAYYIYLMRFGGVDQTVKNAMITTEDGVHWYFINYDNDTIFGVRNDGQLKYDPYIDRQTIDEELSTQTPFYAYAGHDSVLWNNFEADPECMALVKTIDAALYTAGLTYAEVIKMFNEDQSGKWAESIYNQDAQYKYIGPWVNGGAPYLGSLQGSRVDHRKWWVSNRFALYDAIYVNGAYTGKNMHFLAPGAPTGTSFSFVAGKTFSFGYGIDSVIKQSGVVVEAGDTQSFAIEEEFAIGANLRIYAPYFIESLDLSNFMEYFSSNFDIAAAYDEALGSRLKTLTLGVDNPAAYPNRRNHALTTLGGLEYVITLQELNIAGFEEIRTLDLSTLVNLTTLKAKASGLRSVTFANGAPVTLLELPAVMQALTLRGLTALQPSGLVLEDDGENITNIDIRNCPGLSSSPQFLLDWMENKLADDDECSVYMDNVDWQNTAPADLLAIGQLKLNGGTLVLRGTCQLTSTSQEIAQQIMNIFGASSFQEGSEFYITGPEAVYVFGPSVVKEGENAQFSAAVFSEHHGTVEWEILSGSRTGVSIDEDTGLLTTVENGESTANLVIRCTHTPTRGAKVRATYNVQVKQRVYPDEEDVSIVGGQITEEGTVFAIEYATAGVDGDMIAAWSLTGDITQCVQIQSYDNEQCVLVKVSDPAGIAASGTLTLVLTKRYNGATVATVTKIVNVFSGEVAVSADVNPYAMAVLYGAGLCASPGYMTKDEAAAVTDTDLQPGMSSSTSIFAKDNNFRTLCTNFDEFQYFTGVETLRQNLFNSCTGLTSITIPFSVTSIGSSAFYGCTGLTSITIPFGVTSIGGSTFQGCTSLTSITIPSGVTTIGSYAFYGCRGLTGITLPSTVNNIGEYAFHLCTSLTSINIPSGVTSIKGHLFSGCTSLASITIPSSVTSIGDYAFQGCTSLTSVIIPSSVTSIEGWAFATCTSLTSVSLPQNNSFTTIPGGLFQDCTSLTSITIPSSVTYINGYAFIRCTSLTSITIPSGVLYIGSQTFEGCSNLATITCYPTTPPSIQSSTLPGTSVVTTIEVPQGSLSAYQSASNWSAYSSVMIEFTPPV